MIERQQGGVSYLQFSQLLSFSHLQHGIFTRQGGHSEPPYHSLNTSGSLQGGDNLDNVIRNRQLVLQTLDMQSYPCLTLWNIHGAEIAAPEALENWRTDWAYHSYYEQKWTPQEIHKGDALITKERGVALALSFADCTPIVLYDPVEQVIGVAHGGWRGTARGIAAATVARMHEQFGSLPGNIYAGIGPAIGTCCYEVSDMVQDLFFGRTHFDEFPTAEQLHELVRESAVFTTVQLPDRESLRLDLWETNRRQLLMAGVLSEHIEVAGICTSCHKDRFFSHRGDHGKTGRFPVVVALREERS